MFPLCFSVGILLLIFLVKSFCVSVWLRDTVSPWWMLSLWLRLCRAALICENLWQNGVEVFGFGFGFDFGFTNY